MLLSNLPASKYCCRIGPSSDQEGSMRAKDFKSFERRVADDSSLRSSGRDPKRPSEVVAKRGCRWVDSVHPRNSRVEKLNNQNHANWSFTRENRYCNTTHPICPRLSTGFRRAQTSTGRTLYSPHREGRACSRSYRRYSV